MKHCIARRFLQMVLCTWLLALGNVSYAESPQSVVAECKQAPFEDLECEPDVYRVEATQKVKTFASQLKGALTTAIQQKGLEHAVNVCKKQAPDIALALSTNGWTVARTSLKTRNPDNNPDAWEQGILEDFDQRYKAGAPANSLIVEDRTASTYRYMQAIPTNQICLACHGTMIENDLANVIDSQYPQDAATGFTLEDIRGAFTISKAIN